MGITPSTLTEPMTVSAFETETARVRNWLNGGSVVGDFAATSVERSHIYRPDVNGFPKRSVEGQLQELYGAEFAIRSGPDRPGTFTTGRLFVARAIGRQSIYQADAMDAGGFRVGRLGKRVVLDATCWVDVAATWTGFVQGLTDNASYGGADTVIGYFAVQYQNITATSATTLDGTRRDVQKSIYDTGTLGGRTLDNLYSSGQGVELSAGTYDFWVAYFGVNVPSSVNSATQIILSHGALRIAVHRT